MNFNMDFVLNIPYMEEMLALPGGRPVAFIVLLIALTVLLDLLFVILFKIVRMAVQRTKTTLDDRIVKSVSSYLPFIALITSAWFSLEVFYPELVLWGQLQELDIYIVLMLGLAGLVISSVIDVLIIWYGIEIRPMKKGVKEKEVYPFVRTLVKFGIWILFLVFILQKLGFDTTALITGLGIGGLAVALALQDTLANFFAGIHIFMDKPFRQYDYIKLENGTEGTVKEIGWRSTRIRTPLRNEIIVPNSKIAGSILENYSTLPEVGVSYNLGVSLSEDIDKVEELITKALEKVAKKDENFIGETIWVRFDSFGEYSLNFKYGYQVKGQANRWPVLKQVNKEIYYLFKKNKVSMPLPIRVVYQKEK